MKFLNDFEKYLICPDNKSKLIRHGNYFFSSADSRIRYPIINGIPIIINNKKSLFSIRDFRYKFNTTWNLNPNRIYKLIRLFSPSIGLNIKAKKKLLKTF